jgi:starvation-inducible DNA-binding protein
MNGTSRIGLDTVASQELSTTLNDLLANYTIFYQNVRGYHWNVKGNKFFELHLKFEELYNDLFLKIDEIAERILTLGFTPDHRSSKYLEMALIQETSEVNDGNIAVENVLSSFQELLLKQRVILNLSGDIDDEGTNSLMSDYIREQEKLVWMYSSFLNK